MSKLVFRMGSSGNCPKRLSARLLGSASASVPTWLEAAAEEGRWHEQRLKQELRGLGCVIEDEQRELELDYSEFTLLGHIDGRIRLSGEVLDSNLFKIVFMGTRRAAVDFSLFYLLEVKSFSFLEYQRWLQGGFEVFPHYACQSACYEQALGCDTMVYAVKDRSNGARSLCVVQGKQASVPKVIDNLQLVATYVSQGQLAPADFDPSSLECRRCEFRVALCSPTITDVDDSVLEQAAASYCTARYEEKEASVRAEQARDVLIGFGRSKKLSKWRSGPYLVRYSCYPREAISIKRLQELVPREVFEPAISISEINSIRVVDTREEPE